MITFTVFRPWVVVVDPTVTFALDGDRLWLDGEEPVLLDARCYRLVSPYGDVVRLEGWRPGRGCWAPAALLESGELALPPADRDDWTFYGWVSEVVEGVGCWPGGRLVSHPEVPVRFQSDGSPFEFEHPRRRRVVACRR